MEHAMHHQQANEIAHDIVAPVMPRKLLLFLVTTAISFHHPRKLRQEQAGKGEMPG
jgi:NADPH-dependent 7-cyano-7-deazaguanine reductase QueF